jgi:hypothetical protein
MDWFFRKTSTNNHIAGYEIEQFPMPDFTVNPAECKRIATLVNQILSAKKQNSSADTSDLEQQIDTLVYALYGLTAEEVTIVEGGKL